MTGAGRDFLAFAGIIIEKIEQAKQVTQKQFPVKGRISTTATCTVIGCFLPPHLDRLEQLFPNLEIGLWEMNRESIEECLLSNRVDLTVMLTSDYKNV